MLRTLLLILLLSPLTLAGDTWPQWGGPDRNFDLPARDLSRDWGEDGPASLWSRPLGGGFASIVADDKRLYTAFRDGDEEVVIALDPASGETRWEHRYAAPVPKTPALSTEWGKGPNGTPLLTGGLVVTLGFTGHVRAVDAESGALRWSHDMAEDFDVKIPYFGHSASPLAVGDDVVVIAGGVFAFNARSGKVSWQNRDFDGNYGSPILVGKGRSRQIVTPVNGHLAGFNPKDGSTLWSVEHKNQWGTILTTPLADDAGNVFVSAHGVGGLLVDPRSKSDGKRKLWSDGKMHVNHNNMVRVDDWVFSSSGDTASFVSAMSLSDGSVAWKERGFAQCNLLRVGKEFLLLDFDGELAMVQLSEEGMQIVTQATIDDERTWTPPTLLGTTLYIRDESKIMALDLAAN